MAIKAGITDSSTTEVLEGLKEGDQVVIGMTSGKNASKSLTNPFASAKKKK